MKKKLTVGAVGVLALLLVTSLLGISNGFDLFMSASPIHNVARIVLIGALVVTIVIARPRSKVLRGSFALISAAITAYALASASMHTLQLFDTLAYVLSAVILMTESLEIDEQPEPVPANQLTVS